MAAILRSGKFLRLFSGAARNLAAGSNNNHDETGLQPTQQQSVFDKNFSTSNISLQNVLPYIGVSDTGHAEDRFPTRLMDTPNRFVNRVSKEDIDLMMEEIEATEASHNTINLLSSQALLAIRLCGSVLDQEQGNSRTGLVSKIWALMESKGIPVTVLHYNALLRVHLENEHKFLPEEVLKDMRSAGVNPDKETYQCLISRHCQDGDIEGTSKIISMMKLAGIKINENIFNSMIMGHGKNGDFAKAHGLIKLMLNTGLSPSAETYLTLACVYASSGDWSGLERVVLEAEQQGVTFRDGDYLELIYALSEGGHKEHISKVLTLSHPESDNFGSMMGHLVVRLINKGHDDVAYNLVKYTVDNSCDSTGRLVCNEFLDQLVYVARPVGKLLWFVQDMGHQRILAGGLDRLVTVALTQKNFSLACKLSEILVSEGGRIEEKQFSALLKLATDSKEEESILTCVRLGISLKLISAEMMKSQIFPGLSSWPELVIASLEEAGLTREVTTTPMVEWLVGQGRTEAAATVAAIFSEHVDPKLKFLTAASRNSGSECNHFVTEPQPSPPVSLANHPTRSTVNVDELNQAGLERLLDSDEKNIEVRGRAYVKLLELFSASGAMEQALQLSKRLKEEELYLPQFYDMLGMLVEQQVASQHQYPQYPQPYPTPMAFQFSPQLGQFVSVPVPVMHGVSQYYMGPPGTSYSPCPAYPPQYAPSDSPHMTGTPTPSVGTPEPPTESVTGPTEPSDSIARTPSSSFSSGCYQEAAYELSYEAALLHRKLKRAIVTGSAGEGLAAYRAMETRGKQVNVTETSSLVEQLIRADMAGEAAEVTRSMLARDTHPLPKIFRFLLNKLATLGSVEQILSIGQFLPTKIKKDVSFDNRLCNAYLSAGRGEEFLEVLVRDLALASSSGDPDRIAAVKDRFPRGGAMGLLDTHPELLNRYSGLAHKFAEIGYVAPMNVLWTYHFIHANTEVAETIWQDYVKDSNQIMFQKVCQVARATGNVDMAFSLVSHLGEAHQVTSGARGIAYSCLLDCLCVGGQHKKGWEALQEALAQNVALEDINRTALVRLKQGLEEEGEKFPYQIPPKNSRKENESRSLSPTDWNEL